MSKPSPALRVLSGSSSPLALPNDVGWGDAPLVPAGFGEPDLIGLALALDAEAVGPFSLSEQTLARAAKEPGKSIVAASRGAILHGQDPLGALFSRLRSPEVRRPLGATYTPHLVVRTMVEWAKSQGDLARVVDPGAGSARFLVSAGRHLPQKVRLVGVEVDPLAALLARAHLASSGLAGRSTIIVDDFRRGLEQCTTGRTLFLGNPPYVRHHQIDPEWKRWFVTAAAELGLGASQLAGLHAHFFLAIAHQARAKDIGVLITSAEWLDVNYGDILRRLLIGPLGLCSLHVLEPQVRAFPDAATTGVISCFEVGTSSRTVNVRRVPTLQALSDPSGSRAVLRERLRAASRWTPLTRASKRAPRGFVELGELCRVHRGQVTGANRVWIEGEHSSMLPESVLYASITRARELFRAGSSLLSGQELRKVIDLPEDLDALKDSERPAVLKFLRVAKRMGVQHGYIASHRRAWWSVGLRAPAVVLATYMARRPPAFVRNLAQVRHLNIAHGLYPREHLPEAWLTTLVDHLRTAVTLDEGRTYAGGLTKFEPSEMERILVPGPELLAAGVGAA